MGYPKHVQHFADCRVTSSESMMSIVQKCQIAEKRRCPGKLDAVEGDASESRCVVGEKTEFFGVVVVSVKECQLF